MRKSYFLASLLATIFLNAQNNNTLKPAARFDKGFADLVVSEGKAVYSIVNAEKITESLVNFNPVALDYEKASSLDIRKDLGYLSRFTVW